MSDKTMTTYKRADGELIGGEFGWVADPEYFEDDDEPTQIVEEVWALQSTRTVWAPDRGYCIECGEKVPLPDDYDGKMALLCDEPDCIVERER